VTGTPWILAVDLGTSGPKVAVVALSGEILATSFTATPTEHTADGGVLQHVDQWWEGIAAATRGFVGDGVAAADSLHAVVVTGQWGSTVPVDADGRAVGGVCYMWGDLRGAPWAKEIVGGPIAGFAPDALANGLRVAGIAPLPTGEGALGHEMFLRHRRPEDYARTRALLEPVDYLGLRLTGRAATTPAASLLSGLIDTRAGRTRAYDRRLVRRYRRDPARLPPLLPTGSVLGPLTDEAGRDLGVVAGAPVIAGLPDLHGAHLGSGCVDDFAGHLAVSTTSWISCRVPFKKLDVFRYVASVPGLDATSYQVLNDQASGGACLQWWRERGLGAGPDGALPSYEELLTEASAVAPGAGGVFFLPWINGEHSPIDDRLARGGFVNVSIHADRATLTRAVLEGVAFNSRWLLDAVEHFTKRPFGSLRILGGGAQSDLWCQVFADVLGRPIERVGDPMHAQLRGVALFARVVLGELSPHEAGALVPIARRFEPDPATRATYDPMAKEFRTLYSRLKGTYHRLNR
jgi:xylulokinase